MKGNILKFLLVASLVLNLSLLGTAGYKYYKQSGNWVSPFGYKIKKDRFIFEELDLRPEQLKAMKERAIPFRAEIDRRRHEIAQRRAALITLLRADNPDRKAISSAISEISSMQEDMQKMITAHMLEVKASLNTDQQKKFLDLIENAMKSGGHMGCPPVEQQ